MKFRVEIDVTTDMSKDEALEMLRQSLYRNYPYLVTEIADVYTYRADESQLQRK